MASTQTASSDRDHVGRTIAATRSSEWAARMAEAASGDEVLRHACLDAALPSNDVEVVTASMEAIDCHALVYWAPGGDFIFQYSTDDCRTWQALSYAEDRKEWVRTASTTNPRSDDDGIPCEAIMAIAPSDEACAGMPSGLNTPTSVKSFCRVLPEHLPQK
eukprot:s3271_g11.t1